MIRTTAITLVALTIAALSPAASAQNKTYDAMVARCAHAWPNDFAMQRYCMDRQRKAARAMMPVWDVIGPRPNDDPLKAALLTCWIEWTGEIAGATSPDWPMIKYCWDRQETSFRAMYGLEPKAVPVPERKPADKWNDPDQ